MSVTSAGVSGGVGVVDTVIPLQLAPGSALCRKRRGMEKRNDWTVSLYDLQRNSRISLPEHELNRGFISDPLHICNRAAVTAVPLVDKVLLDNKE